MRVPSPDVLCDRHEDIYRACRIGDSASGVPVLGTEQAVALCEDSAPMVAFPEQPPAEDSRTAVAAERRKARMRSLLNTF
jgi:hypothetical protein